jgi:sugar phosphate permease
MQQLEDKRMAASAGNRRWWIMALFFVCYLVLYMDRSCISMAAPDMIKHFGWDAAEYGYVATAFFLGYASSMILGGWLADKFGGGRVVVFGALWWSVFVFITPFGASIGLMIAIRALMGFGEGVTLPSISSMIAQWVPKKETGIAQGLALVGVAGGIAIAMPLTSWIMGAWGWQYVFYAFAFIAPVWVALWWMFGADKPEHDKYITKAEMAYIKAGQKVAGEHAAVDNVDDRTTPRDAFATPSVWIGAASFYCTNYLFYLFMSWLPMYFVQARGMQLSKSAIYTMMPYLVAMVTYPLGGWLADKAAVRFGHNWGRKIYPLFGQLGAGALLVASTHAADVGVAVALISGSNGLLCLTMGGYYSMPLIFSKKNAGKITGLWATFATTGGICAPTFTGLLVKYYGYDAALYCGAGISILGAIILVFCTVKPLVPRPRLVKELVTENA